MEDQDWFMFTCSNIEDQDWFMFTCSNIEDQGPRLVHGYLF